MPLPSHCFSITWLQPCFGNAHATFSCCRIRFV